MKILYAIQGTGNGHIARAEDIIPILKEYGAVDLFISGAQADINLSYAIKYKSKGLSFYFGKNGGVDLYRTFKRNKAKDIYKEVKKFPVEHYDLVINDFEPITAWACRKKQVPCIALSHQASFRSIRTPRPKSYDIVGDWILQHYAPTNTFVGFHFSRFDKDIFTPVVRKRVRDGMLTNLGHYTVYLPAYDDKQLVSILSKIPFVRWEIFSKHTLKSYEVGRVSVYPVNNERFTASMASSSGVLCGAGFETPAEALFARKKLMVVPMKGQYEQQCNAAALDQMGVPVLKTVKSKHLGRIKEWIETEPTVFVDYKDTTREAVHRAISIMS
ncbi:MAG: glycosyltransferase family protein [Chryseolinea sp.]